EGIGFMGIAIALLGRNHAVGMAFAALLWAFLERTGGRLDFMGYTQEIIGVMQGIIVLAVVISSELVRRWGLRRQQRIVGAELAAAASDHGEPPAGLTTTGGPGRGPEDNTPEGAA